MIIEIWSDIVCPFCYLGKRKLEKALEAFPAEDAVSITYKSFQLMPDVPTQPGLSINAFLAREKGISLEQAQEMNAYVTEQANAMGLTYNLDRAVVANTFRAHRLLHHAKSLGLQSETKERLLKAYFTEGKNIDDTDTLLALAEEIGLTQVQQVLESDDYALDVRADVLEARQLGIKGVPFFVFNRKSAISGAQNVALFSETLAQAFADETGKSIKS
ncbi:Predicted dithiol-disulfide isomerase, DsbA family [Cyclobacterium xiamenense]|uniref:Predicted dithiol-disulfide isomerase, DsbA family n=1 Tax=Cyclobacterium xiamenense TaxID=1297121 RepID=A0A1H6WK74_9BACT|nr:DsbA family oxidoreductase [Cyclobacterium xiamenense]SEJ13180.1 Predicted dithiol-disulfide isomerase, DsbA family [Cyclobacterium xiamenense]